MELVEIVAQILGKACMETAISQFCNQEDGEPYQVWKIETPDGCYVLKKAIDVSKDQSYVLYSLKREMLPKVYFPLGDITKSEARKIAEEMGFVTAHKSDSQDICFVPDGDYASVISEYSGK